MTLKNSLYRLAAEYAAMDDKHTNWKLCYHSVAEDLYKLLSKFDELDCSYEECPCGRWSLDMLTKCWQPVHSDHHEPGAYDQG